MSTRFEQAYDQLHRFSPKQRAMILTKILRIASANPADMVNVLVGLDDATTRMAIAALVHHADTPTDQCIEDADIVLTDDQFRLREAGEGE